MKAIQFKPLSSETWPQLEQLFGAKGACGGCWCMYWRLTAGMYSTQKGEANRTGFLSIIQQGLPAGVMAFDGEKAIAWCAVAPRQHLPRMGTSRILKPLDDQPVWSVHCFFLDKAYRGKGISVPLLKAAVEYARENGATIIEGYPIDAGQEKTPDVFAWTGLAKTFIKAGFKEAARRSEKRPVMRFDCSSSSFIN